MGCLVMVIDRGDDAVGLVAQIGLQQQFVQTGLLRGFEAEGRGWLALAVMDGNRELGSWWGWSGEVGGGSGEVGGRGGGAQTLCSPVAASLRPAPPLLACLCRVEA